MKMHDGVSMMERDDIHIISKSKRSKDVEQNNNTTGGENKKRNGGDSPSPPQLNHLEYMNLYTMLTYATSLASVALKLVYPLPQQEKCYEHSCSS